MSWARGLGLTPGYPPPLPDLAARLSRELGRHRTAKERWEEIKRAVAKQHAANKNAASGGAGASAKKPKVRVGG
jgi:hypothetical protein